MFFSPNNLYAWEKVPVPDYVDKKTKLLIIRLISIKYKCKYLL